MENKSKLLIDSLIAIIHPYDCINIPTVAQQEDAKQALIRFYCELKKTKPDRVYNAGKRRCHCSYLLNLLPLYRVLKRLDYCEACHELLTVIHYEPILQGRIYHNVLDILSKYLGV